MFLLSEITALCLMLIVAFGVTSILELANKMNTKMNKTFEKETTRLHKGQKIIPKAWKDEKGNITFFGILISLMLVCGFYRSFLTGKWSTELIRARADAYLCFNYLNQKTKNYIHAISKTNRLIIDKHPKINKLIKFQVQLHNLYLEQIRHNRYCNKGQKHTFKENLPFKTQRNQNQTISLRKKKWTVYLFLKKPSIPKQLQKRAYVLAGTYQLENQFSAKLHFSSQEMESKDLPFFGHYSGPLSSVSLLYSPINSMITIKKKI